MSESYRPWDREQKLGPPPWKSSDPKVIAWEAAHGHDARLKCYPELGCALVEQALENEIQALSRLGGELAEAAVTLSIGRLDEAIDAWEAHMRGNRHWYPE